MARWLGWALAALMLSGCAALRQLPNEVSTFSQWPAERKAGRYVFERLPSQQARPQQQQLLEDAARPALEAAGFAAADDEKSAEFVVQIGARVTGIDLWPYDDPFWRGRLWYGHRGRPYWGLGFGMGMGLSTPTYEREVAVLIRERGNGKPLYEARASNDGGSPSIESLLPAMYQAALADFPYGGVNPRRVVTEIR